MPPSGAGEVLDLAVAFAGNIDAAGFSYLLGGSLASSLHGASCW